MTLYKILNEDGTPYWGGKGKWHLPKCGKPGKWMPPIKDISLCEHGYHVLKPEMLLYWLGPVIFEVEVHGAARTAARVAAAKLAAATAVEVQTASELNIINWNETFETIRGGTK